MVKSGPCSKVASPWPTSMKWTFSSPCVGVGGDGDSGGDAGVVEGAGSVGDSVTAGGVSGPVSGVCPGAQPEANPKIAISANSDRASFFI